MFLSRGDGYLRELPELYEGCQVPFCISGGNVGFLWRQCSGKGPHLALSGESRGFSRVLVGILGYLSSCDRDLRDPLVLLQRSRVSFRDSRGTSGFLSSRCRQIGLCLQCTGNSVFLSSSNRDLGLFINVHLESQASSSVEAWNSAFLSSCARGVRAPVEFWSGIWASSRGSAWETGLHPVVRGYLGFH